MEKLQCEVNNIDVTVKSKLEEKNGVNIMGRPDQTNQYRPESPGLQDTPNHDLIETVEVVQIHANQFAAADLNNSIESVASTDEFVPDIGEMVSSPPHLN